jgi:hypothetical protein
MMLPDCETAVIDPAKLRDYQLDSDHPSGGPKAAFFLGRGFRREEWQLLEDVIRELICREGVSKTIDAAFGTMYIVEGAIGTPLAVLARIRTVWQCADAGSKPTLITAMPMEGG